MPAGLSCIGRADYHRCPEPGNAIGANLNAGGALRPFMLPVWRVCRSLPGWIEPRSYDDVAQSSPTALRMGVDVRNNYQFDETEGETGYSWLHFSPGVGQALRVFLTLALMAG